LVMSISGSDWQAESVATDAVARSAKKIMRAVFFTPIDPATTILQSQFGGARYGQAVMPAVLSPKARGPQRHGDALTHFYGRRIGKAAGNAPVLMRTRARIPGR